MSILSRIRSWFPESSRHLQKKIQEAEQNNNVLELKHYIVRYCHLTAYETQDVSFLLATLNTFIINNKNNADIYDAIPDILDFLHRFDLSLFNDNGRSLFLITEMYCIYGMCRMSMYNNDYDGFLTFYDEQRENVLKKGVHYFGREFLMLDISNRIDLLEEMDHYRDHVQLSWGQLGVEARLLENLETTIESFYHFVNTHTLQFFDEFDVLSNLDYTIYMLWCHGRAVMRESNAMANQYFERAEECLKKVDWLLENKINYEMSGESAYLFYVIRHYRKPELIQKEEIQELWAAMNDDEKNGMTATLKVYENDVEHRLLNMI